MVSRAVPRTLCSLTVCLVAAQALAEVVWYPVGGNIRLEGLAWTSQNAPESRFHRLPDRARTVVQKVNPGAWDTSLSPSGARVRWRTDSSTIQIRASHGDSPVALPHMASTGVAGMDLFEGIPGRQVYRGTSRPQTGASSYTHVFVKERARKAQDFALYLPTYAPLTHLEIGLDADAQIEPPQPYAFKKPIVFYGTSITQSGCSSRGSLGYVPLLGRLLNVDVINLGFSGAGMGDPEVASLVAEIDAAVFVVDSVANMNHRIDGQLVMDLRYEAFVRALRSKHPKTPILLMTQIRFADVETSWGETIHETDEHRSRIHRALYQTYERMRASGDRAIHVFDAGKVIRRPSPQSGEHPTVDGIHLTDHGFYLLAESLRPVLKGLLRP